VGGANSVTSGLERPTKDGDSPVLARPSPTVFFGQFKSSAVWEFCTKWQVQVC